MISVKILNGQTSLCCDLMQAVSTLAPTRIEEPEPGLVQDPRGNPFRQIWIIGKNGLPYVHHNFTQVKTSDEMLVSGLFSAMANTMQETFADTTVGFEIQGLQHRIMSKVYPKFIIAGMADPTGIDTIYVDMLLVHIGQLFLMSYDETLTQNKFSLIMEKFECFQHLLSNLFTIYATPTDKPLLTPMAEAQPTPNTPPVIPKTGRIRGFFAKIWQRILTITKQPTIKHQNPKEMTI